MGTAAPDTIYYHLFRRSRWRSRYRRRADDGLLYRFGREVAGNGEIIACKAADLLEIAVRPFIAGHVGEPGGDIGGQRLAAAAGFLPQAIGEIIRDVYV